MDLKPDPGQAVNPPATWPGARASRPSWRSFWGEGRRLPGYSLFDFLHGYVYARWTYLYIGLGTGERQFPGWVRWIASAVTRLATQAEAEDDPGLGHARGYHGKVVPLDHARQLVRVDQEIRLTELEHVIPYPVARDIVLQNPDHIVALDCPCRASRADPCLPLDVCLIVGEPFAGLVLRHHPMHARAITPATAEQILESEHARGHVHHAFFKDAMLGRFYAICNCCPCCCGAMQSTRKGTPMLASSGYVCVVDESACLACGLCADCCPFDALAETPAAPVVDVGRCMGCGVCVSVCEGGALSLARDLDRPAPLLLEQLLTELGTAVDR
jgi:formate hydrogenlyase subunit 6/NADH:ubiquinone oxidoreductase subunit I